MLNSSVAERIPRETQSKFRAMCELKKCIPTRASLYTYTVYSNSAEWVGLYVQTLENIFGEAIFSGRDDKGVKNYDDSYPLSSYPLSVMLFGGAFTISAGLTMNCGLNKSASLM